LTKSSNPEQITLSLLDAAQIYICEAGIIGLTLYFIDHLGVKAI
jgi:hypothetical protein